MPTVVQQVAPLGFPWVTIDPFLFCVHHEDAYPEGNPSLGPVTPLTGRSLGNDFTVRDGFRMYHGHVVPGFPKHPHRGFETVTFVRRGLVDHSDSLGATARYGGGDVQWLTAGAGIQHAEMFPCVHGDRANPLELFQIWLNLPKADKFATPYFKMLWAPEVPIVEHLDERGRRTVITVAAGHWGDQRPPSPPPSSWASRADSDVAIMTLVLDAGARVVLPPAQAGTGRVLYFFRGDQLAVGDHVQRSSAAIAVAPDVPVALVAGNSRCEVLVLQGRPIGEPVVQHGPFVMNSQAEIAQAFADYRRTEFGGWPWKRADPVHPAVEGRFAMRPDGGIERPTA